MRSSWLTPEENPSPSVGPQLRDTHDRPCLTSPPLPCITLVIGALNGAFGSKEQPSSPSKYGRVKPCRRGNLNESQRTV